MTIQRSGRRIAAGRISTLTRELLGTSSLCAIASVSPGGRAHVNTAYFAAGPELELVWLSEPEARHSRNLRANPTVAIAVYDSMQSWGAPDRGIQLFGSARDVRGAVIEDCEALYQSRFPAYREVDLPAYRFYRFRPRRLKLFDELELGPAVFVTAKVGAGGRSAWERTEVYS
jgi:uncharacterized protein YhbP (UPF0306 family)